MDAFQIEFIEKVRAATADDDLCDVIDEIYEHGVADGHNTLVENLKKAGASVEE